MHTNSFEADDVKQIAASLQENGIRCEFYWSKKQGTYKRDYPVIYISSKDTPLFFEFIGIESPIKCYNYKFDIPSWFAGAIRITHLSNLYKIPNSRVRHFVSKLENNNSPYIKRRKPKGRIWILKEGISKVVKLCK